MLQQERHRPNVALMGSPVKWAAPLQVRRRGQAAETRHVRKTTHYTPPCLPAAALVRADSYTLRTSDIQRTLVVGLVGVCPRCEECAKGPNLASPHGKGERGRVPSVRRRRVSPVGELHG